MTRGKTMISKMPARAPIYFSALMALALMLGAGGSAQAKFNLSNVGPDYGCLLSSEDDFSDTATSQLMQLHTDRRGEVLSGSLSLNFNGEVCTFTLASGTYTINRDHGTGTITLTWTFSTSSDGDEFCTTLFPGTSFTESFAFVLERSGMQLDLASLDPALIGAAFTGTDPGDFTKFGSCFKQ